MGKNRLIIGLFAEICSFKNSTVEGVELKIIFKVAYIRLKCVQTKIGNYGLRYEFISSNKGNLNFFSECDTDAKCAILRQGKRDWIRNFMKNQIENENPLFCPAEN